MEQLISSDNHGIVSRFIRQKGYGQVMDLTTKKNYSFSSHSIVQQQASYSNSGAIGTMMSNAAGINSNKNVLENLNEFNVGSEVIFDIKITGKGRRPNDPSAVNIRSRGKPFQKTA